MGLQFSAGEIFQMACQIERNGAGFYRKAAGSAEGGAVKDKLLGLAAMEDEHERTFAKMAEELSDAEQTEPVYDPDGQAALYLQAFAGGQVFDLSADPSDLLTGEQSLAEIFGIAIGLERDSIAFYVGIQEMVPGELGKDKIGRIIKEEMGHVTMLSEELAALRD